MTKKITFLALICAISFGAGISVNIPCEQLRAYENVCDVIPAPPVIKPTCSYTGSIQWETGEPFAGDVRLSYDNNTTPPVLVQTTPLGDFIAKVFKEKPFYVAAFNAQAEEWVTYINKIRTNEGINWQEFNMTTGMWGVHTLRLSVDFNLLTSGVFYPDKYALNFRALSPSSFKLTPTSPKKGNQGAYIEIATVAGEIYEMLIHTNKKVNVYFSNVVGGKYTPLRNMARITGVNKPITLNSFKAIGSRSYFYFAPQEAGEMLVKSVTLKEKNNE